MGGDPASGRPEMQAEPRACELSTEYDDFSEKYHILGLQGSFSQDMIPPTHFGRCLE
ncbi:Protein of unknown function [Magnetospira sp. QH-2]|nr:Protein of unknown function [Magnetospira sp. QH-2]